MKNRERSGPVCNAYNHKPGCECGFGPHYLSPDELLQKKVGDMTGAGIISVIRWRSRRKWASKGITNQDNILKKLAALDVNSKWINSIYKKYVEAGYPINESQWNWLSKNQQLGAERRLLRLLGLREEIVEELADIDLKIPLFRLQPPRTKKSKVSFRESISKAKGWKIFLEIPGFGLGADLLLRIETGGNIETSEEECKIIFLPVRIKRKIVNLFLGNICIAKNKLIAEAGNKKMGQVIRRTVKTCKDYIAPSPGAPMIAEFDLSQDFSESNSEFYIGWGNEATRYGKINFPIPGIKPGIGVKIELERELRLDFNLESRYDYKLYPTPDEIGISWIVEKGQAKADAG
jgi:hypothetical protein